MKLVFLKKFLPLLFFLAGLICFILLAADNDIHAIFQALLRVGPVGFLLLFGLYLLLYPLLAFAWKRMVPDLGFIQLIKSRMIRDAASSCLPFSQMGGIFIGTYATITFFPKKKSSQAPALSKQEKIQIATAANIADITTEAIAQALFILTALTSLFLTQNDGLYLKTVGVSVFFLITGVSIFSWIQKNFQKFTFFLLRIVKNKKGRYFLIEKMLILAKDFKKIWRNPLQIFQGITFHYLGWVYSAFITFCGLFLLGYSKTFIECIAFEGISCAIISTFFFVPTAIGVQESAYISLGLIFGIPAEISFSLSLLRRFREILIGFPILFWWEGKELLKNVQEK